MLTNADKERFDTIMQRVMDRRSLRTTLPERDEVLIASTIKRWEDSAAEQHRLLVESRSLYGGHVGKKSQANKTLPTFPQMADLKQRFGT